MPPVSLSADMLFYTDCSVFVFPVKMRKCPPLLNVNVFRGVERDIKGCGEIGKRMLLAFSFRIGIAESHRGVPSPSTAWKLKPRLETKAWLQQQCSWECSLQTVCVIMVMWKNSSVPLLPSKNSYLPSLLLARSRSLLLGGLVHPALCLFSYSWPLVLPSAVFKQHFCQSHTHQTSNFKEEIIPDAFLTCAVIHFS